MTAGVDNEERSAVEALVSAIEIITARTFQNRVIRICIGQSPYLLRMAGSTLRLSHDADVTHSYLNDLIFLDFAKIQALSYEVKVATILEELAHCVMNIKDESFVRQVVVQLYPRVRLDALARYQPLADR